MHKTTFNAMYKHGCRDAIVTVWDKENPFYGKAGKVINLIQPRTVVIKFANGEITRVDHRKVANGDNSL